MILPKSPMLLLTLLLRQTIHLITYRKSPLPKTGHLQFSIFRKTKPRPQLGLLRYEGSAIDQDNSDYD